MSAEPPALPPAPSPPRSPWQSLYGALLRLRRAWFRRRAARLPRPVISVGNLSWGGAGKTPVVAAVAAHLRDRGRRVAVLSRGYGRDDRRIQVVRTWDEGPLVGPKLAGDEPVLLAGQLAGVAVVVGADRAAVGVAALERLDPKPDLFVLDDAFSHLRLARDVDLLVFPLADPWAGGRLPPAGRLREPLAAAARADAALLTGENADAEAAGLLAYGLAGYGFAGPAFAAPTRSRPARWTGPRAGGADGEEALLRPGTSVYLVSAIARPASFAASARRLGYAIAGELAYRDHHAYPERSLEEIAAGFGTSGAEVVLTTSKDAVKLYGRLDLPLAELPIAAEPEEAFWRWLDERLVDVE